MKIRAKIFLFIFIASFLVFTSVIGFIVYNYRNYSIREANRLANVYADHAAELIGNSIEKDLAICETLTLGFTDYQKIPEKQRDEIYSNILKNILDGHPEYLSVWMTWELRFIDKRYTKKYGRKRTITFRKDGMVNFTIDTVELMGDKFGSPYYEAKISGNDVLLDPYYYVYSPTEGGDSVLETSVAKPIMIGGEFAGLVAIDLTLSKFQKIIAKIVPFENSTAILLSNNGLIISNPAQEHINDSIEKEYPEFIKQDLLTKIKEGKSHNFQLKDTSGITNYVTIAPVHVGNSPNFWSVCIVTPSINIEKEAAASFNLSLLLGTIGILILSVFTLFIAQRLTKPLKQTTAILNDLDKGIIDFSKKIKVHSKDELAEMGRSINNLMDTLNRTAQFAKKIGEGDFNAKYNALSEYDVLGNILIDMQKNLRVGQEKEEIRQLERMKLTWAQEGLSELGEVLRTSLDNFEDYLLSILSFIIKYIKADQGAIFILNTSQSEHPYLELRSAYAYNKKKALETKLEIGESLVGRCFQEKEIIYMTNIPEGYTFVSSGLGGHEPRCLFLMPLLFEDEPFGVIELASFRELADFEIDFLKSIGERVASSISVMEKNVQTKKLLEQYQVQSKELQNRERLLQENLKELQKIQEDASTVETESKGIIEALSTIGSIIWYNKEGKIIKLKDTKLAESGFTSKELLGKDLWTFAVEGKESPVEYDQFWDKLRTGTTGQRTFAIETKLGRIWLSETYTPIKDRLGNIMNVISVAFNITERKKLEDQMEKLKEESGKKKKN